MITLGYSKQSAPSALKIAEASGGLIRAVRGPGDINWGRRRSSRAKLNPDNTNAVNKRMMRGLFRDAEVRTPEMFTPHEALRLMEGAAHPSMPPLLLGRPDFHTRGKGMWLCADADDVSAAIAGTRRVPAATHFMEWLEGEGTKEMRVHVFKGKSIRISEKHWPDDSGKYVTIKPTIPKKPIRLVSKAAVEALGLDFGVVDVLVVNGEPYVLEVNTAPGLGGSMPRVWAETFINYFNEGTEDDGSD